MLYGVIGGLMYEDPKKQLRIGDYFFDQPALSKVGYQLRRLGVLLFARIGFIIKNHVRDNEQLIS